MARQFGETWWGKAWLEALEERGLEDPSRLPRGRTYARQGRVSEAEVGPGLLRARVEGTETYYSSLHIRQLDDHEWDLVLDTIMGKAAHAAALLSGEVPTALNELLLPASGDLSPDCTCPDWAHLCKHAAALCYVAADVFDADPFALLALRGRSRNDVLSEVRRRRSGAIGATHETMTGLPRGSDPGMNATAAHRRVPLSLEQSAVLPRQAATRSALAPPPPADSGIDPGELSELIDDAAQRAWRMLADGAVSGLALSVGADVVRRSTTGDRERIAAATKLDPDELEASTIAWEIGGLDGLRVSQRRWDATPIQLAPGVAVLGSDARVRANTVLANGIQLRLDEDGRWWRFDADDRLGWVLSVDFAVDPADLVQSPT